MSAKPLLQKNGLQWLPILMTAVSATAMETSPAIADGGAAATNSSPVRVTNTVFYANHAEESGGALRVGGALELGYSSLSANTAGTEG